MHIEKIIQAGSKAYN